MVTKLLHPSAFVLTNIFRDQMDRYGEIYTTYEKIVNGIKLAPDATIIANGDASILKHQLIQMVFYVLSVIIFYTSMNVFMLT